MLTDSVQRVLSRLQPELLAGYHLPVFARVESISDAPARGGLSDWFRPRYAVNVTLLNQDGDPDPDVPQLDNLPVLLPAAGEGRGQAGLPQPGTIVEIAWAYGSPKYPFVRGVLPTRQSLPACDADWQVWQQRYDCRQLVDDAGNWERSTDGDILDRCQTLAQIAQDRVANLVSDLTRVSEHSNELITGIKRIEAGALKLLAAGHANLSSADNLNLTSATDVNLTCGRNCTSLASGQQHIEGSTVWLGDNVNNLLTILAEFMAVTADALTALAGHTHGPDGLPTVKPAVEQQAADILASKTGKLDPMTE